MCCRFFTGDEEDDEELRAIIDALQRCGGGGAAVARDVLPTDTAAVIASSRRLSPGVFAMRWGFSGAGGAPVINARSETAHERPMFAESIASRRCLIPAGWYYEWERRGRERVRYAIRPEEAGLMYMAGLYRLTPAGAQFTILTRGAAPDIAFIHPRMPVILPRDALADWIDPRRDGRALLDGAVEQLCFGAC